MMNNLLGYYGGIELKKDVEKNTYLGFTYSVGFHALLLLLYVGSEWLTNKESGKATGIKQYASIFIDIPPLLSAPDPIVGSPKISAPNPRIGIPIAVPDVPNVNQIMPINDLVVPGTTDHGTGDSVGTTIGTENHVTTTSIIQNDI